MLLISRLSDSSDVAAPMIVSIRRCGRVECAETRAINIDEQIVRGEIDDDVMALVRWL